MIGNRVIDHERVRRTADGEPFEVIAIYEIENNLIIRFDLVREAKTVVKTLSEEPEEYQVEIRQATARDAELLASLGRQTFHDAYSADSEHSLECLVKYEDEAFSVDRLKQELSDAKAVFFIAEIDRKAVGYAKLLLDSREPQIRAEKTIELVRLYSRQEFIGKGIGAALMQICLDEAAKFGCETIWLSVWEHNLRAQAFYRKWKFETVDLHIFNLDVEANINILMERRVDAK